jgi:hypothetical protein
MAWTNCVDFFPKQLFLGAADLLTVMAWTNCVEFFPKQLSLGGAVLLTVMAWTNCVESSPHVARSADGQLFLIETFTTSR